ncbi:hypothetical protein KXX35_004487, partial [Aspergillus fumigatus]
AVTAPWATRDNGFTTFQYWAIYTTRIDEASRRYFPTIGCDLYSSNNSPRLLGGIGRAMTSVVGQKALNGEWERISNKCFEIQEDMIMTFE